MSDNPKIFTLKQVANSIRKTIEERYQSLYWVKAEMHKLNQFASGHCFPELLQKEEGKIVAQMTGSIWKHNFDRINTRFMEVVKEPLKDDMTLLLKVKVSFHETYGLSLQILDIDPNYVLGELQRERQETLLKLKKENLLDANQKLQFPLLPKRLAIISAETSKGLSDFNKVLDNNQWGYKIFRMIFPAYLQGDLAAKSISEQLDKINNVKHHFDAVLIVRGGGGEVGMSCYNNFELCKRIASFPLPVLTGIGHSTNFTVAEMIAYRNAITPTELGEFILQAFHNFSVPVQDAVKALNIYSVHLMERFKQDLNRTSKDLISLTKESISESKYSLERTNQKLVHATKNRLTNQQNKLSLSHQFILNGSKQLLKDNERSLRDILIDLPQNSNRFLEKRTWELEKLENKVALLDPINVLKRGFSITTFNGETVKKNTKLKEGDAIETLTADLKITSTITKKENNE